MKIKNTMLWGGSKEKVCMNNKVKRMCNQNVKQPVMRTANLTYLLWLVLMLTSASWAQPDFSMIGFATQNGGTKGGAGGDTVWVHDYAGLKQHAESNGSQVIVVQGRITNGASGGSIRVRSNKTIVGLGSDGFLDGVGLSIASENNIIVQNLKMTLVGTSNPSGVNGGDIIGISGTSKNIWIDHCELYSENPDTQTDIDKYDGLIDIKGQTGYITLSWNYFHDHHKGGLVGASDTDLHEERKVTMHHNYYNKVRLRVPMYRGSTGHFFNNYVVGAKDATEIRAGTCVRVERNYYEALHYSIYTPNDSKGFTERIENIEVSRTSRAYPGNCTANIPYDYSQALIRNTQDVKTIVPMYAGVGKINQSPPVSSSQNTSSSSQQQAPFDGMIKSLYPASGTVGQCLDTPLRMVLHAKPKLGYNGSIRIVDINSQTVVHTWAMHSDPGSPMEGSVAAGWPWQDDVGHTRRNVWPLVLDSVPEYLAEIRIPAGLLQPGKEYGIEVDAGVLQGSDGIAFEGVASGKWVFTTQSVAPQGKNKMVVAQDNSGDVCSVQGGLNLVQSSNNEAGYVLVQPGYYREMVASKGKKNIHLYGAGREKTFIRYYNSNNLNEGSSLRNIVLLEGDGAHVRAMHITSTVTVTGGQAEALYLKSDKAVVANVHLQSHQDTWLNSGGRAYVENSIIEGSVDFVWGYNPVYFKNCDIIFTRKGSVVVQPRNSAQTHGYVFNECTLRAKNSAFTDNKFARDAGSGYPDGEVAWLNTQIIGNVLAADPWTIRDGMDENRLRFCEYKSKDGNGNLLTITGAQRQRLQCTDAEASNLQQVSAVLDGWQPQVVPLDSVLLLVEPQEEPVQFFSNQPNQPEKPTNHKTFNPNLWKIQNKEMDVMGRCW
jgi:pectate lyase